ncbi:MAG: cytochrome c biogenesis protein CcsA [Chlamydiales bacterium]|nr:cytochrome c biogenesis protein CcsA [Chlamydiales bacterium]
MRWLILLILFTSHLAAHELSGDLPLLYEGRIRPLASAEEKGALFLPGLHAGEWFPLDVLERGGKNPTPYPDPLFLSIRESYLNRDWKRLDAHLKEGYSLLEGTNMLQAASKHLAYPTMTQIKVEFWLVTYPFLVLLICSYALAAVILFFSHRAGSWVFLSVFFFHTLLLAARIYVLKRPPVSNMAETLLYVPWTAALVSLLFGWLTKKKVIFWAGAVGAGIILLIFWFSRLNEKMESLQPVLDSNYWLGTHVLLVVGSYGLFLLASVLSHIYLIASVWGGQSYAPLPRVILQTLYIGTGMLVMGTLLGGVWAAESWGRFWDWDPKESWAFVSGCVYLLVIHSYLFRLIGDYGLALGAALGFFAISFTWYGVNYILGTGLHSYGFGSGGEGYYTISEK